MTKDKTQIEILDSRRLAVRIGLLAMVLLALVFGWFAVRWQFGDMLADLTAASDPNAKEIAALAIRFAPADPTAHWLLASARKDTFTPEAISERNRHGRLLSGVASQAGMFRLSRLQRNGFPRIGTGVERNARHSDLPRTDERAAGICG